MKDIQKLEPNKPHGQDNISIRMTKIVANQFVTHCPIFLRNT